MLPTSPTTSTTTITSTTSTITTLTTSLTSTSSTTRGTTTTTTTSAGLSTPTPLRNTGKRGLSYNNVNFTQLWSLSGQNSQVSWSYDYSSLPNATDAPGPTNPALTFVPLLFNDANSLTSVWAANVNYSIANYGTDALLSFNEPDLCATSQSACMSVPRSVAAYKSFIQPFANTLINPANNNRNQSRLQIGAPAVTNSGTPGASLTYLQWFLGNCTGCQIDFVAVHWYESPYNFADFMTFVSQAYAVAGGAASRRQVWVTEFGMDGNYGGGGYPYYDPDVIRFLKNATTWMDAQPWIGRYAWFGDFEGLLLNSAGTALSNDGLTYNNWTGGYVS